jgi:hypothetical protein
MSRLKNKGESERVERKEGRMNSVKSSGFMRQK